LDYFKSWSSLFDLAELTKIILKLNNLYKIKDITPSYQDVFKAFTLCDKKLCKVIFIGQDPYPQKGVATGLLFANKGEIKNLSPSLQVIKESCINYTVPHNFITFDQTLESWATQGVLLLNSALTCEVNKIGSHLSLWLPFISSFLERYSTIDYGNVYVLFGERAKNLEPFIDKRNLILKEKHPAYYARTGTRMPSKIFTTINTYLKDHYNERIRWFNEE